MEGRVATILYMSDRVAAGWPRGAGMGRSFDLSIDPLTGVAICRILGPIDESGAELLAEAMADAIADARSRTGIFRLLFDNRVGASFGTSDQSAIRALRESLLRSTDRVAALVSSSIEKIAVRSRHAGNREAFLSESAALTWLAAWD